MGMFPTNYWVMMIGRTIGWAVGPLFGGVPLISTALSDLLSGSELAQANGELYAVVGAGVMLGQLIGDNVMIVFGARFAFAARAVMSAVCELQYKFKLN